MLGQDPVMQEKVGAERLAECFDLGTSSVNPGFLKDAVYPGRGDRSRPRPRRSRFATKTGSRGPCVPGDGMATSPGRMDRRQTHRSGRHIGKAPKPHSDNGPGRSRGTTVPGEELELRLLRRDGMRCRPPLAFGGVRAIWGWLGMLVVVASCTGRIGGGARRDGGGDPANSYGELPPPVAPSNFRRASAQAMATRLGARSFPT